MSHQNKLRQKETELERANSALNDLEVKYELSLQDAIKKRAKLSDERLRGLVSKINALKLDLKVVSEQADCYRQAHEDSLAQIQQILVKIIQQSSRSDSKERICELEN